MSFPGPCSKCGSKNTMVTAFGNWIHCLDCRNTIPRQSTLTESLT